MDLKKIDAQELINSLFTGKQGNLPKLFYVGPILLWLIGGCIILTIPNTFATPKANPTVLSDNLQDDINAISEKAEDSKVFDMTKKEIMQANKKASFIGNKMRQKLDKSEVAKSDGQFDGQDVSFDTALNRTVYAPLPVGQGAPHQAPTKFKEEVENMDDLSYVMDEIKKKRKSQYENGLPKNANYDNIVTKNEAERKGRLAQAKEDNRRRRADIDKTQTEVQAQAYEQAIQDNEQRYRHFYGLDEQGNPIDPKAAKTPKAKNEKLGFFTALGAKDNLKLGEENEIRQSDGKYATVSYEEPESEMPTSKATVAPQPVRLGVNQIPLIGVIDQAQKIKSGDKVQIRISQEGLYQGLFIPQNTILYGLCAVNKDRIKITIPSINLDGEVFKSDLIVYDPDGLEGIYVDGTFNDWTKEAVKEGLSAGNSLGVQNTLGNFSLKLGRKANNRARVYVPGGYQVFLYDLSNSNF